MSTSFFESITTTNRPIFGSLAQSEAPFALESSLSLSLAFPILERKHARECAKYQDFGCVPFLQSGQSPPQELEGRIPHLIPIVRLRRPITIPPTSVASGVHEARSILSDISMQCPEGWEREGSKCFKVYHIERSWPQALIFCGRYGSTLARIESQKQNSFVTKLLNRPQRSASSTVKTEFWIGLLSQQDGDNDAMFLWSDGSSVSRYVGFWGKGQPDYRTGSCAKASTTNEIGAPVTSVNWQLEMCNMLLPFVCELPACTQGSFFCHNGACVPESAHCNGVDDCGDLSDELNCPASHAELACLKYERGESGKIQSPNYPSSYRANSNCRWVVEGPINSRIQLIFESFETEDNQDIVTITDGGPAENASVAIDIVSGTPKIDRLAYTSSTNMLVVRFRSDSAIQARGFQASWRAVSFTCGGRLKAQLYTQAFSSPEYPRDYPNGLECVWRIDAPEGHLISLTIDNFDLEDQRDFVVIYDGAKSNAPVLSRLTGRQNNESAYEPQLLISSQNHIYVYFYSNYAISGKGFSISYKRGCDNIIRQSHGQLLSPGHTRVPYAGSQICKYTVELPESRDDQPVSLAINHFDVPDDDFLQVYEGGEYGRPLHEGEGFNENTRPPKVIYAKQSKVQLVFQTNSVRNSLGWNITFSTNCPTLEIPDSVSISTHNTAFSTKVSVSCSERGYEFISGRGRMFEVQCLLGGKWTENRIPACQPVYCSPVPQIANGYAVSATNVSFGGIAKYSCYDGFSFSTGRKTEEITCSENGQWSITPECKTSSCPALIPFTSGERKLLYGDGTGFGTVYSFECDAGYRRKGAATILCQPNGEWSTEQPRCEKLLCANLPEVKHGKLISTIPNQLAFDDVAQVQCVPGYRTDGVDEVKCLANQTLSTIPKCVDVDECAEQIATCSAKSTKCVNLPGGYFCECKQGFKPQTACQNAGPLSWSSVETSSEGPSFPGAKHSTNGWCALQDDNRRTITFTFPSPKVVERLRIEKTAGAAFPTLIRVNYAMEDGVKLLTDSRLMNITLKNVGIAGSELILFDPPVEAKVLQLVIEQYKEAPCIKVEMLGCQKTSCSDINECETKNGRCEHHCINMLGSYRCSCDDGFDLFTFNGQNGVSVKEGETGEEDLDAVRFNKSCVPRQCSALKVPENGELLATTELFHYPTIVEFRCDFGFQMMGPSHLKCQVDGNWNGTSPFCIPAVCQGAQNNTAIGLFIAPEGPIPYGNNISIVCSQQNRPGSVSPLAGFRQCIYDPQPEGLEYWLSGPQIFCPLVDCGPPPVLAGVYYEGDDNSFKVGSTFAFNCRAPYALVGKSSYDDRMVRCNVDGTWDLGNLRCEGPVCVDPGYPDDGTTELESVEEGAVARFTCNRPGFAPFPAPAINCTLGTACVLSEDVGISSGFIPDGAFADNSDSTSYGYEPHKARLSSTGWCGSKDAFIFLSVDLQRIYTLTTLRMAGVANSGYLKGHVTKMQLFYKVQFSQNYDTYPLEFETPSGNHNKMYQFELNPPMRARYVLLGITEYETNPCLRFDMMGCLAPLSAAHEIPTHLQVGWNSSVPQCIDSEPPVFHNCPQNPIFIFSDEFGQLMPANYDIPTATDNSGSVAYIRVQPANFIPPRPITSDMDVVYTAFDEAGNSAECIVRIRIPDTQPPVLKCPDSYALSAEQGESERTVFFNETSVELAVQDMSNITEITFEPALSTIKLGGYVTVEATATDEHSNRNKCKFQVSLMPQPCSEWALASDSNLVKECTQAGTSSVCNVVCATGFRFVDATKVATKFTCNNGTWSPSDNPPACVPIAQEPARYELNVAIKYSAPTPVGEECLKSYTDLVANYFETMDTVLSQRCSSSVQVFVRFLNVKFTADGNDVVGNYSIQILPTVLQDVFYELCGLTMRTIFDLRIPGATTPIRSLLMISGDSVATNGVGCPSINASITTVTQGFGCADGEVLRDGPEKDSLPECFPCAKGTVYVNNTCVTCPVGTYQDQTGQLSCKSCPASTFTQFAGAQSVEQCLAVCGNGMFSKSGLVPCQLCPRHTFAGPPILGGYKQCESCPEGSYTAKLGATGPSYCKQPCQPGFFSTTGLEPCSPCPLNFYQPSLGQQRCVECSNDTYTKETGRSLESHCESIDCSTTQCQNRGSCAVNNHKAECECRPGYTGQFCEEQVPLCDTQPCLNNGICEATAGTFRCICPQNFTGARCQFGPDECIGINCPNGGVCQDLPGLGTSKCICRTGFTGPDCSQIADPCLMDSPCRNGADCIPLQLGRYKCKCLPGWNGPNCEHNIGELNIYLQSKSSNNAPRNIT
uniref:Sushi, von Willebrand factor type A, EGF and pentraxin domain-containing protein 1 n=1 Tax=Panagrellus redivivus TaxID=6233 RepID=A0A7E4V9J7_PANRE